MTCNLLCSPLTVCVCVFVCAELQGIYQQSLLCRRIKNIRQKDQKGL